jgi:hypothetical protein
MSSIWRLWQKAWDGPDYESDWEKLTTRQLKYAYYACILAFIILFAIILPLLPMLDKTGPFVYPGGHSWLVLPAFVPFLLIALGAGLCQRAGLRTQAEESGRPEYQRWDKRRVPITGRLLMVIFFAFALVKIWALVTRGGPVLHWWVF